eukprot:TRINITY_DN12717_c3_g1_i1.p1 TRINITY_DN12717_c3_g1~~TRINITY_DN12717_c3_g1_i1.p1  ORF type:complete len:253 (+),score=60.16 TRINITY_DN12717_c3_g1_i1:44-802(+)
MNMNIPLKVMVTRSGKVDSMRRITLLNPSFEVVSEMVKKWVAGEFELGYKDDEGDIIIMDTDVEWEECLRLWRDVTSQGFKAPLRLEVRKTNNQNPFSQTEKVVDKVREVAERFFDTAIRRSQAVTFYNQSCDYSLDSKPEEAFVALEKSLELGYVSFRHISADADLDPIRGLPQFEVLMKRFFKREFEEASKRATEPTPEESAILSLRTKYALEVSSLESMGLVVDENVLNLLQKHDGFCEKVIEEVFASS